MKANAFSVSLRSLLKKLSRVFASCNCVVCVCVSLCVCHCVCVTVSVCVRACVLLIASKTQEGREIFFFFWKVFQNRAFFELFYFFLFQNDYKVCRKVVAKKLLTKLWKMCVCVWLGLEGESILNFQKYVLKQSMVQ